MNTNRNTESHPWFAWYPVRTEFGDWIWLETVQREWKCWPWFHWKYTQRSTP